MASQQTLKPQFFVTRQNGNMVPLIAMDELPIHVQIEGVSRSLGPHDIAGMIGIGTYEARHEFHVVRSMNNTTPIPFYPVHGSQTPNSNASPQNSTVTTPLLCPTTLSTPTPPKATDVKGNQPSATSSNAVSSSTVSIEEENKSSRPTSPPASPSPRPKVQFPTTTTTTPTLAPLAWRNKAAPIPASTPNPPADPDPEMPPPGQKIYCSYWLRNGECNFAQQGCMYKHVMPLNLQVLEVLGFRDLPDWYRKTYKCGSLRVNGGRNGLSYGILDGNVKPANKKRVGPDTEATKRMVASHINAVPTPGSNGRGGGGRGHYRGGNNNHHHHRGHSGSALQQPTAAKVDRDPFSEKMRRDARLRAAFDADLNSEISDMMMDPEMERIREQEQAGWEEEQAAARKAAAAAVAVDADKTTAESTDAARSASKEFDAAMAAVRAAPIIAPTLPPGHAVPAAAPSSPARPAPAATTPSPASSAGKDGKKHGRGGSGGGKYSPRGKKAQAQPQAHGQGQKRA
ncbi:uncharacterized protein Z520_08817 [Fonsecaea multimorphosa CBS 102226]|uniref:C3H1-type domain-containing protein n=1 Tax=Fonsecaea multimorphosa CBS 102226 TaxID=1442371 RepID=A0A0D2H0F9_9EURO|nr:uncharacterized protein Z520_08817 [Fonsecaea multimorphosa CBS 102226]KIX95300.1 hypothetical protein Z520_08817 [Fonsecaea multimorphosa CBS 102226]OAL21099.1 hypothetical protein AYO22_08256 [Fonsecaea multimorphosa]